MQQDGQFLYARIDLTSTTQQAQQTGRTPARSSETSVQPFLRNGVPGDTSEAFARNMGAIQPMECRPREEQRNPSPCSETLGHDEKSEPIRSANGDVHSLLRELNIMAGNKPNAKKRTTQPKRAKIQPFPPETAAEGFWNERIDDPAALILPPEPEVPAQEQPAQEAGVPDEDIRARARRIQETIAGLPPEQEVAFGFWSNVESVRPDAELPQTDAAMQDANEQAAQEQPSDLGAAMVASNQEEQDASAQQSQNFAPLAEAMVGVEAEQDSIEAANQLQDVAIDQEPADAVEETAGTPAAPILKGDSQFDTASWQFEVLAAPAQQEAVACMARVGDDFSQEDAQAGNIPQQDVDLWDSQPDYVTPPVEPNRPRPRLGYSLFVALVAVMLLVVVYTLMVSSGMVTQWQLPFAGAHNIILIRRLLASR